MAENTVRINAIAHIQTDFPSKFGIPRQSGIAKTVGKIVFEPKYRSREALRGLEGYSHIWLIWQFSEALRDSWSPTVRPPRLGGNRRVGVFASRSPFRPNSLGLSSVKILNIDLNTPDGPVIYVEGADMMDNTPIFDIKPYLPFADCHIDAVGGFADEKKDYALNVTVPKNLLDILPESKQEPLKDILSADPRPSYQDDPTRCYGFSYAGFEIKFHVDGSELIVSDIIPKD